MHEKEHPASPHPRRARGSTLVFRIRIARQRGGGAFVDGGRGSGRTFKKYRRTFKFARYGTQLEDYLSSLGEWEGGSLKETLYSLISGDGKLDYTSLADGIISLVWEEASALCRICRHFGGSAHLRHPQLRKIDILHSSMSDIITFVGYLAVGGAVLGSFITAVSGAFRRCRG